MATFVALLVSALAYGAVLSLAVLGFLVLYNATGVINFAHGDLITLGGYLALWLIADRHLPTVIGYLGAVVLMGLAGVILERIAYAPLRDRPHVVVVIATLAAATVIRALIALWQGSEPRRLPTPVGDRVWHVAGADIAYQRIMVILVALVTVAGVVLLFQASGFGRQLRALATDPLAASLYGVNVRFVSVIAWALSAALAALAGILLAPLGVLDLNFGFTLMIAAFAAAVVGGFGNLWGALIGSLAVGLIQQLVGGYVLVSFSAVLPYMAMLILLALRPQGLLGSTKARL